MKSIAIIYSIIFVILRTSSVDCCSSAVSGISPIDLNTLCARNPIGFQKPCRKFYMKQKVVCDYNNNDAIGTDCIELIPENNSCPKGQTSVDGVCRNIEIIKCPEGQKLVNDNCEEIVTTTIEPEPCPTGYKRFSGECRNLDPTIDLCAPGLMWSIGRCRFGRM